MFDAKYNDKDPGKYQRLSLPGGHRSSQRGYEQEENEQQENEQQSSGGMFSRFTESLAEEMGNLGLSDGRRSHRSEGYDDERTQERTHGHTHGHTHERTDGRGTRIQLTRR